MHTQRRAASPDTGSMLRWGAPQAALAVGVLLAMLLVAHILHMPLPPGVVPARGPATMEVERPWSPQQLSPTPQAPATTTAPNPIPTAAAKSKAGGAQGEEQAKGGLPLFARNASKMFAGQRVYLELGKEGDCTWRTNYGCKFFHYITCVVLGRFPVLVLGSPGAQAVPPRAGDVVLLFTRNGYRPGFLRQWAKRGFVLGAFHIGDEKRHDRIDWYTHFDFVLHNYFRVDLPPHAIYTPIGPNTAPGCIPEFPSGVVDIAAQLGGAKDYCACTQALKPASARGHHWNFLGLIHRNRAKLLELVKKRWGRSPDEGVLQSQNTFGGPRGHNFASKDDPKYEYYSILYESMFTFAPCGNVEETHRMYEALSIASIPVVEVCETNTSAWFKYSPVLHSSITGMVDYVAELTGPGADLSRVDALQREAYGWWLAYTEELSDGTFAHIRARTAAGAQ